EIGAMKKTKKKLKVKKKVVGTASSGKKLTINVKEERKKITDDEILDGLAKHDISTFDLVPFDEDEDSESLSNLNLMDTAEEGMDHESDDAESDSEPAAPVPKKKLTVKTKKSVRFEPEEEKSEEKPKAEKTKEDKKLKKIKDMVKEEDDDADKNVFSSLDELRPHLNRFKMEQHLRRWLKKLLLTKRITVALRNEAADEWKDGRKGDEEGEKKIESKLTKSEFEALVQMEGTLEDVKKAVNLLVKEGRLARKECADVLKKWKIREKRRVARQLQHAPLNLECFNCRKRGHVFADCPEKKKKLDEGTGICFKCGSMEHAIYKCPKKDKIKGFPHATCFICNTRGHLSRDCEKNDKGIYIDGGSCGLCGSKMHLRKNCDKQALKEENELEKEKTSKKEGDEDGEEKKEKTEKGEGERKRGTKRPAVKTEDTEEEGKKDKSRVLSSKKWGKQEIGSQSTTITRPVASGPATNAPHVGGDDDDFQFLSGESGDTPFETTDDGGQPAHKRMKMFGGRGRGRGGGGGFGGDRRGGRGFGGGGEGFRGRGGGGEMRRGGGDRGGGFRGRGGDRGGFGGRGRGGDGGFRGRGGGGFGGDRRGGGGFRGGREGDRGGGRGRGRY
ncbi:hypothetical protein PFISCL1PPCAC_6419, partial [Pristionchus fissidentatus]